MRNTLAALALAAAASALPRNALATRCNRTIRLGVYRVASPAAALGLTTELDYNGACVANYNQPFGETALARVDILAADALVDQRGDRHAVAEHAGAAVAEIIKGRVLGIDRAVDAGRHRRQRGRSTGALKAKS